MGKKQVILVRDTFAADLGKRIDEAWRIRGLSSRRELGEVAKIRDESQLGKWANGKVVPDVRALASIAKACRVSLDWLVLGDDAQPTLFLDWLEKNRDRVSETAEQFLRAIPLMGHIPSPGFYNLALQAYELGLSAADASAAARQSDLD